MPTSVAKKLEAIRSIFFWGEDGKNQKMACFNWDVVLAGKNKGGLDIGSLVALNFALLYIWR